MKEVIVFAGSNSKNSINKKLAELAAKKLENIPYKLLDINDFELPLYGIDRENEKGIPEDVHKFNGLIENSSGIILSLAEHNGSYSTAFKNLFDWLSRIDGEVWKNKPMLLMTTSPGPRGGMSVMEAAQNRFPFNGGNIITSFSLPNFSDNYSPKKLTNDTLHKEFLEAINKFENEV